MTIANALCLSFGLLALWPGMYPCEGILQNVWLSRGTICSQSQPLASFTSLVGEQCVNLFAATSGDYFINSDMQSFFYDSSSVGSLDLKLNSTTGDVYFEATSTTSCQNHQDDLGFDCTGTGTTVASNEYCVAHWQCDSKYCDGISASCVNWDECAFVSCTASM